MRLLSAAAISALAVVLFVSISRQSSDLRTNLLNGRYDHAYRQALADAGSGDPAAQNTLGNLHYLGLGAKKDYGKAASWYMRAALAGHGPAQANLGHLYAQGLGVPKDVVRTLGWYLLSQKSGYKEIEDLLKRTTHENHFNPLMIAKAKALFSSLENVKKELAGELDEIANR